MLIYFLVPFDTAAFKVNFIIWASCEQLFGVGCDSGRSSHEKNHDENGSQGFKKEVCSERTFVTEKWEPDAPPSSNWVNSPAPHSIYGHLYVCDEGKLSSTAPLSRLLQKDLSFTSAQSYAAFVVRASKESEGTKEVWSTRAEIDRSTALFLCNDIVELGSWKETAKYRSKRSKLQASRHSGSAYEEDLEYIHGVLFAWANERCDTAVHRVWSCGDSVSGNMAATKQLRVVKATVRASWSRAATAGTSWNGSHREKAISRSR